MLRTFNDFDTDPDIYAARRQGGGHGFAGIQLPLLWLDEVLMFRTLNGAATNPVAL